MSPAKWDELLKAKFGLATAMAWPLGDRNSLRVAMDWMLLLFNFDDLLDEASSNFMRDESGATEVSKIFISAFVDPENFEPVPSLPMATACHEYVLQT